MLQSGPLFSGHPVSPLDTPGLSRERVAEDPAQQGAFPGARSLPAAHHRVPLVPASGRGPAGREDGHLAGGDPRFCGPGWRAAGRPTPSDLTDAASRL